KHAVHRRSCTDSRNCCGGGGPGVELASLARGGCPGWRRRRILCRKEVARPIGISWRLNFKDAEKILMAKRQSASRVSGNLLDSYVPFPRQAEFHSSPKKYRLFGGAAGPGKTKALLWEAIIRAQLSPRSDALLLR